MPSRTPSAARAQQKSAKCLAAICALGLFAFGACAIELKPEAAAAFDRYVRIRESQMDETLRNGEFFVVDGMPKVQREQIYSQVRHGDFYIEQLHTLDNGSPIRIPGGLIEHWVGLGFIPGGTLAQTIAVFQDYDHHSEIYKPNVLRSKLLSHEGNLYKTYMRFDQDSLINVVVDVYFDNFNTEIDSTHSESRTHSTRIAEVRNAGKPDESEIAEGKGHGFLWRLYTYWRLEELDGGVYVQSESIALSRSIPRAISVLVNPFVKDLPRKNLSALLTSTRAAVVERAGSMGQGALH